MKPQTLELLCHDGFTARMAQNYLDALHEEDRSDLFDPDYRAWAHSMGFLAESAYAYRLNESNAGLYLSDYDFYRLWPLNGWQRIWINDKLTLNALVQDSNLARYVPRYFYYSESERLLPLNGSKYAPDSKGFLATLQEQGEFACKPCNGAQAKGFHRLSFENKHFAIDGTIASAGEIKSFVDAHPNYVFTEYLNPAPKFAEIDPLIHTLRVLVINPTGINPIPVASYLRFGIHHDGDGSFANYVPPTAADICSFNVQLDLETGGYGNGKLAYANRIVDAPRHPVSNTLVEGVVPRWAEILEMIKRFALKVGACEYLGFDIGITSDGPKVMEINSHTGVKYLQLFHPALAGGPLTDYYRSKLSSIEALDETAKAARNRIVR